MSLIQCKLMVWSMLTLCFRVTHFGTMLASLESLRDVDLHLTCCALLKVSTSLSNR
ncbi:hypothetical protein PF010_g13002 [Phytophthora fragariae]|uniref:Uncharacterized protein n=2 Tax=Phytophthora TaxID=4783 RepID=A0A6A4BSY0_9STRA|nr:hypothetical protein PR002_g23538 [Phytophthora rubi]KAE8984920.1 hypothetical protein PR001_g23043 [Phytophthora rubi]KAE9105491.1 hypothetical protein PF010_g13002 [Phytophthora fragariae]KAE9277852.1 hypothetical protein PF001_g25449 [Phytophthora fragariae]KAE9294206.1 hypothetical protein PF008_g24613 [Phytophthora fragariae]